MIQVQSVWVTFPVAKYWLSCKAADGQNAVNSGCAGGNGHAHEWHLLLPEPGGPASPHQAASLGPSGALGAFCHSSLGSCAQCPPMPHMLRCQEWRSVSLAVSTGFLHCSSLHSAAFTCPCFVCDVVAATQPHNHKNTSDVEWRIQLRVPVLIYQCLMALVQSKCKDRTNCCINFGIFLWLKFS